MKYPVYTVSQVNEHVKGLLDADALLSALFVRGEISNYKLYPSGHHYFSLKDAGGSIRCVMFRRDAAALRFRPENGMKVAAFGRVGVFPRDGQYQLYVSAMMADGVGDLHAAFEQLKKTLAAEGLFDPEHKKPLPRYPQCIALVTSPAGAAVRDMLRILGQRWPAAKVYVVPTQVQGVEAAEQIAGAIRWVDGLGLVDVIITGRGGGSMEDLWCFNDQRVARAIYECKTPVISAVGHEPDVTIADYVSDVRAATPSNGAELAVPDRRELLAVTEHLGARMVKAMEARLGRHRSQLERCAHSPILLSPMRWVDQRRMVLTKNRNLILLRTMAISLRALNGRCLYILIWYHYLKMYLLMRKRCWSLQQLVLAL